MFLNIDQIDSSRLAILDDSGQRLTYGDAVRIVERFKALNLPRCVVFNMCENSAGSLLGYLAFESNGQIPLMLAAALDKGLLSNLDRTYTPAYYWMPKANISPAGRKEDVLLEVCGYVLVKTEHPIYPVDDRLSMLLTTSGSTGSPKLVRHKYGNLEANAENVARVFEWTPDERGICDLPMNYTMGLNVINSHLVVGASVLLMKANLMDPDFWEFVRENGGTDFCGVPFSYEIMRRIGFQKMDLPKLKTLAEGGGKLTDKMFSWIARYASDSGRRFCATFGTSETSARMTFLDPAAALERIGSIGKAIPGGELFLADEKNNEDGSCDGELGYRGPNVTMGYAVSKEDLMKGDEFSGEYLTGDIAKRDRDGFYYIVGRKKRFLKLFGLRVSLDETERILKTEFGGDFVCLGNDRKMTIFTTNVELRDEIVPFISGKTHLHNSAFGVSVLSELPRNEYGKIRYAELEKLTL